MKSETEIKQRLDDIKTAFNDDRDIARIYTQAFNIQQILDLEWVLEIYDDPSVTAVLERYNKNVKPKRKIKRVNK